MKQWISSSKALKPLIRSFLPNPWEHALMEFRYGLWTGISPIFGEDDRQLGEGNTRPLVFNQEIPADVHACKYKGSRNGRLINISALRVAMSHFYEASAITVAVRDYHMQQINKPLTDMPGLWDQYVISRASLGLIAYRYRSQKLSAKEKLPNSIGSQYKLVTGIFVICREMANAVFPASSSNKPVPAVDLYAYADEHKLFESGSGMVCAGSVAKIIEFLEFSNQGRSHREAAKLKLEGADDHLALLGTFVSNLEDWYRYALLTIELDYYIEIEALRQKMTAEPGMRERLQPVLEVYQTQYTYWLELLGTREEAGAISFEEGALSRQNTILDLLKMPQVKSIPDKVMGARLELEI